MTEPEEAYIENQKQAMTARDTTQNLENWYPNAALDVIANGVLSRAPIIPLKTITIANNHPPTATASIL